MSGFIEIWSRGTFWILNFRKLILFLFISINLFVILKIIVSILSVPSKRREEEAISKQEKFQVPESEHLTLLHLYQQ